MICLDKVTKNVPWFSAILVGLLLAGCGGGGGQSPILGLNSTVAVATPVILPPPTVTAVAPVNNATGVPLNTVNIVAALSEPIVPVTGAASFTLTCASPCVSPNGTVALNSNATTATLVLANGTLLAPSTVYTATVNGVKSVATGLTLVSPYVWTFTTGLTSSLSRPSVTSTIPVTQVGGSTTPANSALFAIFSRDMAPGSISTSSFTLSCSAPCVAPSGIVTYVVDSRTAVFVPGATLTVGSVYTATITTAATDLANNALGGNQAPLPAASNYV